MKNDPNLMEDFTQYRHIDYQNIVKDLKELSNKAEYKDLIELHTAQALYKLPNPGGFCDEDKKQ